MNIIAHRINTLQGLKQLDNRYGAELDIRSQGDRLVIHHDPFEEGEEFLPWIDAYTHGTLILNIKEEGLEGKLIDIMAERNISDYFFLDQSFPFLVKWANKGERRCAVRFSEFESADTVMQLAGKVDWIWVDCFTALPLTKALDQQFRNAGFKLCLVSPELQGRGEEAQIEAFIRDVIENQYHVAAVCTKRADLWERAV